jgi:parallel beta-helix repeat protein
LPQARRSLPSWRSPCRPTRQTARRAWPATRFRIFERGHSAKVTNSLLSHNNYGIVSNGTGSTFSGSKVLNNAYDGVYLAGSGTTLTRNVAQGNALVGIRDVGSATTLTKNIADYNGDDGIVAGADPFVVDRAANSAKANDYNSGDKPIQCDGVACS